MKVTSQQHSARKGVTLANNMKPHAGISAKSIKAQIISHKEAAQPLRSNEKMHNAESRPKQDSFMTNSGHDNSKQRWSDVLAH